MRPKEFSTQIVKIERYVSDLLALENDVIWARVLEHSKQMGTPPLQVTAFDARHLEVLSRSVKPSKILEFGTLCGFSAVTLARGLQPGGQLYTVERSDHHARVAQNIFKELALDSKITLLHGNGLELLDGLIKFGKFDLIFIDSDKEHYPDYFEWCVTNLNSGGLLIADNTFALGYICDDLHDKNEKLKAIVNGVKKFNQLCADDHRLVTTLLPTGEGLLVAVKK